MNCGATICLCCGQSLHEANRSKAALNLCEECAATPEFEEMEHPQRYPQGRWTSAPKEQKRAA